MSKKWKDVSEDFRTKAEKFWDGLVTWNYYDHVRWEFQGHIDPKITDIDPETELLSAQACILPTVEDDNEIAIIIFDLEKETFRTEILNATERRKLLIEDPDPEAIINKLAEYTRELVKKINYQEGGSPIFERIEEYGINP